jgi:hypothetical protein
MAHNQNKELRSRDRRDLRLVWAGALIAAGLAATVSGAHTGDLRVGAGDVAILIGKGETGLTLAINKRTCPPHCGVDFAWRPSARLKL